MALINCKECGAQVSSDAKTCPNCGIKKPAPKKKSHLLLLLAIFAVIVIAVKPSEEHKKSAVLDSEARNPNCKVPKADGLMAVRSCDLVKLCKELDTANQTVADTFGSLRTAHLRNESDSSEAGVEIEARHRSRWQAAQSDVAKLTQEILVYRLEDIERLCPLPLTKNLRSELDTKANLLQVSSAANSPSSKEGCDKSPLEILEIGQQVTYAEFSSLIAEHCRSANVTEGGGELSWGGEKWAVRLSDGKNGKKTVESIGVLSK